MALKLPHLGLEDTRTEAQRSAGKNALVRSWKEANTALLVWDKEHSRFVVSSDAEQRMLTAGATFRGLEPWQRALLRRAASQSNMLYRRLYVGDWTAATRALRGLALRLNKAEYTDLATKLEIQVSNGLEGVVYVPPRFRKEVAAAA